MAWTKEQKAAYMREWRKEHKERIAAERQTLKGKYLQYKNGAKPRNIHFNISFEEFKTFWQQPCHYCGDQIETIGLDRIDNNIGYELYNLRPCCTTCNVAKNDQTEEAFEEHIIKLYNNIMEKL
jgi:hypothetical protein